jgi:hypothetical protein
LNGLGRWRGGFRRERLAIQSPIAAQNQHRLHFGLRNTPKVDSIKIRWPSGKEQVLEGLPINTIHYLKETP